MTFTASGAATVTQSTRGAREGVARAAACNFSRDALGLFLPGDGAEWTQEGRMSRGVQVGILRCNATLMTTTLHATLTEDLWAARLHRIPRAGKNRRKTAATDIRLKVGTRFHAEMFTV